MINGNIKGAYSTLSAFTCEISIINGNDNIVNHAVHHKIVII